MTCSKQVLVAIALLGLASTAAVSRAWGASDDGSPVHVPPSWSDAEKWAWSEMVNGRAADLRRYPTTPTGERPPATAALPAQPTQALSPEFLAAILTQPQFVRDIPPAGVSIRNARFTGSVVAPALRLRDGRSLTIEHCVFEGELALDEAYIGGSFVLRGCVIRGGLSLKDTVIEKSFLVAGSSLGDAEIGGTCSLPNTSVGGTFQIVDTKVGVSRAVGGSSDHALYLPGLQVRGLARIERVKLATGINLNAARLAGDLRIGSYQEGGEISLQQISVVGHTTLNDVAFGTGSLNAYNADFQKSLNVMNVRTPRAPLDFRFCRVGQIAVFAMIEYPEGEVDFGYATFGSNLALFSHLHRCVLRRATIAGGLLLYQPRRPKYPQELYAIWQSRPGAPSELVLESCRVQWISDGQIADPALGSPSRHAIWPAKIVLQDFTFGGWNMEESGSRPAPWFLSWLEKDENFARSSSLCNQLSNFLKQIGREDAAESVKTLYFDRKQKMSETGLATRLWLLVYGAATDYGQKKYRIVIALIGLFAFGVGVLWLSGARRKHNMFIGARYSFARLFPVLNLTTDKESRELLGDGVHPSWLHRYFFVHSLLGYAFTSLLGAALADDWLFKLW